MKVHYKRVGSRLAPLLEVGVHMPALYVRLHMLVDSGAEETLLPMTLLDAGRVVVDHKTPVELFGVGSGPIVGFPCTVEFSVGGYHFQSRVVGVDAMVLPLPILGEWDFFHHFGVTFEAWSSIFIVRPAP